MISEEMWWDVVQSGGIFDFGGSWWEELGVRELDWGTGELR